MKKGLMFQLAVLLLSLSILAGIYTFWIIPNVRKAEKEGYEKILFTQQNNLIPVLKYMGLVPLMSGAVITDINKANFVIENVPVTCLVKNAAVDFSVIEGKQLKYTIMEGQQVSSDMFQEFREDMHENKRLKEFKVKSLVGGHVKKGTYVDIIARYPDGSYEISVTRICIYDILCTDSKGSIQYLTDKEGFYTVILAVDEDEFRVLNSALLTGYLDTRLYISK